MSRVNKVNPDHYKTAGRLAPDDLAREQSKQNGPRQEDEPRGRSKQALPGWKPGADGTAASEPRPRKKR